MANKIDTIIKNRILNGDDTSRLVDFLKVKLCLQDWLILSKLVTRKEIGDFKVACTRYTPMRNRAVIWLIDPEEVAKERIECIKKDSNDLNMFFTQDMVQSVMHEMLHIKFGSVGMDTSPGKMLEIQEGFIDWLAEEMVTDMRRYILGGGSYDK